MRHGARLLRLVALVVAGYGAGAAPWALATGTQRDYSLPATVTCLRANGATVGRVRPTNPRLRALRDLAQSHSRAVRIRGATVGLAVLPHGRAPILAELLVVPRDPYRIVVMRNAILMYRPADRGAFVATLRCLRS